MVPRRRSPQRTQLRIVQPHCLNNKELDSNPEKCSALYYEQLDGDYHEGNDRDGYYLERTVWEEKSCLSLRYGDQPSRMCFHQSNCSLVFMDQLIIR